jgi:cystathionine beta-lyase/cystathionine gamma-synthase
MTFQSPAGVDFRAYSEAKTTPTQAASYRTETLNVIGGYERDKAIQQGSLAPPLYQTVAYPLESAEIGRRIYDQKDPYTGFVYTRRNNPTNDILEKRLALIEGGEAGLVTSSGMAAISSIASYLLEGGAECVISNRVYLRCYDLFMRSFAKFGVKVHVVADPTDLSEWDRQVRKGIRFAYVETPSNPGLVLTDIKRLAELTNARGVPLIVDNTLATPVSTKPLELGAAVVIESVSKYISGNATMLGGALVTKKALVDDLRRSEYVNHGMAPAPFNSWLCLLGLETLHLRMARHSENGLKVARFLEGHPKVARVHFPGLESHPQHALAKEQMNGLYGGLLSFSLKEESMERAFSVLNSMRLITTAIHESAARSVITHPPSTNFVELTDEEMEKAQISKSLIRFSAGLEHPDDLIEDFEQALDRA